MQLQAFPSFYRLSNTLLHDYTMFSFSINFLMDVRCFHTLLWLMLHETLFAWNSGPTITERIGNSSITTRLSFVLTLHLLYMASRLWLLAITHLLSVSTVRENSRKSYKQNHTSCSLWDLTTFSWNSEIKICHVFPGRNRMFLFMFKEYFVVWIYQIVLIHSSTDGLFLVWAATNNAAMKIFVLRVNTCFYLSSVNTWEGGC